LPPGRGSRPPRGPYLLLDVTVYGLSPLGGARTHGRSGGFPGRGADLREQEETPPRFFGAPKVSQNRRRRARAPASTMTPRETGLGQVAAVWARHAGLLGRAQEPSR